MEKWPGVIRRVNCQEASEDSRWEYEPVSDFFPDVDPSSDYRNYGSSDEGRKYQDKSYDNKKEEVESVPIRNPRRIRQGDQRALKLLKSHIEKSKDEIFSSIIDPHGQHRLNVIWYR